MEHSTTTTDVRDLDCLFLATIGGADYYELRQIVRQAGGVRRVVGLASDWPLIHRDARITELTALLAASEQRSVEADCHVAELLSRLSAYEEHIAAHEMAAAAPQVAPAETPLQNQERMFREQAAINASAAAAPLAQARPIGPREDGKIPCDHPGCLNWVSPRGLGIHKRKAHGIVGETGHHASMAADQWPEGERRKCPYCRLRPLVEGMDAHIARAHPERLASVGTATDAGPIVLALGERPWACDRCHESTHARSLKDPALCIRCVVASADAAHTNGHLAAA